MSGDYTNNTQGLRCYAGTRRSRCNYAELCEYTNLELIECL